jgi:glycosyltransferase involved in cell wall biosynthesis
MTITVCIPVFNRRDLVGEAIRSVLAQDVEDLDLLVVDNCSTDGTWEYLNSLSDSRLRVFRNERNIGMFGNFNRCGELASGDFVLFLCSDDRLAPGFLAHAIRRLDAEPRAVMLNGVGHLVDETGKVFASAGLALKPGLYEGSSISSAYFWIIAHYGVNLFNYPSGILFRTTAARAALPFREDIGGPADIDYFLRVLEHGALLIDEQVGCEITVHRNQTANKNKQSGAMIIELNNLARLSLDTADRQPFWNIVRSQLSAGAFAWALRKACAGNLSDALQATKFGSSWPEMIVAGAKRGLLIALRKCGIFFRPHARRV